MGILTQIVAAHESEVEAIGESLDPRDEWAAVERREIDIPKLAMLHSVLTGDLYDYALALYEPIYISPSEGAFVIHVSEFAAERLAELDESALEEVANELAATEEYEYADLPADVLYDWLAELADLARGAQGEGLALYAWLHPLRT